MALEAGRLPPLSHLTPAFDLSGLLLFPREQIPRGSELMEEETVDATARGIIVGVSAGALLWVALFVVVL